MSDIMYLRDALGQINLEHLSPSSINSWTACPAAWVLSYVKGHKQPPNEKMVRGSIVEDLVFNHYDSSLIGEDDLVDPIIQKYEQEGFFNVEEKFIEETKHMVTHGWRALRNHLDIDEFIIPELRQYAIRQKFHPCLNIIGFIDGITNKGRIIDIKTSTKAPAHGQIPYNYLTQFGCYYSNMIDKYDSQSDPILKMLFPKDFKWKFTCLYLLTRQNNPTIWIDCEHYELLEYSKVLNEQANSLLCFLEMCVMKYNRDQDYPFWKKVVESVPIDVGNFRLNGMGYGEIKELLTSEI